MIRRIGEGELKSNDLRLWIFNEGEYEGHFIVIDPSSLRRWFQEAFGGVARRATRSHRVADTDHGRLHGPRRCMELKHTHVDEFGIRIVCFQHAELHRFYAARLCVQGLV